MNIVIANTDFGLGGLQRVSKVIGENLAIVHQVYYYSMFSNENYYEIKNNFYDATFPPLQVFFIKEAANLYEVIQKIGRKGEFSISRTNRFYLNKLVNFIEEHKIDLVILSGPVLISCISYLKKKTNVSCIAWAHNNFNYYAKYYTKGYTNEFFTGVKQADAIVCLTNSDLKEYTKVSEKAFCIYNPLTLSNNQLSTLKNKQICFTGRIDFAQKGIEYLIEVAKRLPEDWVIKVAGGGTKAEVEKFCELIEKFGLEKKINFSGPLTGKNLTEHYLHSSIYLMTSRWEGMPLVLAEAMCFGLPIVAFEQSGSSEVLAKGKYGALVKMGDIESLMETLEKLMKDFSTRKQYQNLSLQRVKGFEVSQITADWLRLIDSIC